VWSVLITSSSDRDCRTMFTVHHLTQVAQIHRDSENPRSDCLATVSLGDRELLYHDASIVHTTCVASVTMNSVCYMDVCINSICYYTDVHATEQCKISQKIWSDQIGRRSHHRPPPLNTPSASRQQGIMLTLYKSIVRPHLEYCSPTWSPYYNKKPS